jgi:ribosomal protein S18 acetylase RimI-like enzyme
MTDNPKAMARSLRAQLHERGLELSHGECLDLVARQLGHRDWNVLAARAPRASLVQIRRSCEWVAMNGEQELGRITADRRPNDRWYVACDTWYDAAHDALVATVADDLAQDLYAIVADTDEDGLRRYAAAGFIEERREDDVTVDVAMAREALAGAGLPPGYRIVSAADIDDGVLRILDDTLRIDVPGSGGWVNDPQEFREYTFATHFDKAAYLVALDTHDAPAGLVRIWAGRPPRRLGLIGVLREHRRRGIANALLAAAFTAVAQQGVTSVVAEVDVDNVASRALLERIGARRTGGTVELRRPA